MIGGFSNVRIQNLEEFFKKVYKEKPLNVDIQFFDAELVATWQHLYFAVLNALTAFKNSNNISKSLAMEIMIYASAQRQIRKAVNFLGIKPSTSKIAVIIVGEQPRILKSFLEKVSKHTNAQQDNLVLDLSQEKMTLIRKAFEISDTELETILKKNDLKSALVNLVIERMALLATRH